MHSDQDDFRRKSLRVVTDLWVDERIDADIIIDFMLCCCRQGSGHYN